MMKRLWLLLYLSVSAVYLVTPSYAAQDPNDPGEADTVRFICEDFYASPVESTLFSIEVTLYNDQELCAATYGFYFDSDDIRTDSVSWLNSSVSHLENRTSWVVADSNLVALGFAKISEDTGLVASDTLLATIWFTALDSIPAQQVTIDSGYFPPAGDFLSVLCEAVEFTPQFLPGEIEIGVCLDPDTDGYGTPDYPDNTCPPDNCPDEYNPDQSDSDADSVGNVCDNCPDDYNPDQTDTDQDGIGDVCEYVCGDADGNDIVNVSDAVYLIGYIFGSQDPPDPLLSGDCDCNEIVNISDVVYLISYIFGGGPEPCAACP